MLCISPMNIARPNGQGNKDRIMIPCGKCVACLTNRRNDWTLRLKEELKNSTSGHFVTLTYEEENLPFGQFVNTLDKRDLQLFIKRLRKHDKTNQIRYYAVGEYGTKTQRAHYHLLIFNLSEVENIHKAWKLGHIKVSQINGKCIHYVTKYHVNKTDYPYGSQRPFALMSKNPAIGSGYIKKQRDYHEGYPQRAFYTEIGGVKKRLPRYFKTKLYSKEELTQISIINGISSNTTTDKKQLDYKFLNPTENYFKHDFSQKVELNKKYKQKINHNNTF